MSQKSILNKIKVKFGDFVQIRNLNCFPNLSSNKKNIKPLFKTYDEFINANLDNKSTSRLEMFRRMDLLNEVIINECYLDYFDKYK